MRFITFTLVVLGWTIISSDSLEIREKCSTISCVHVAAKINENLDAETNPCDDFYQFACGGFLSEIYTPDEKSTVNTKSIANGKIQDTLLKFLQRPSEGCVYDATSNTGLVKMVFKNCMDANEIKDLGKRPLLGLLERIGGSPMLNQKNWGDLKWDWKKVISILRNVYANNNNDIFENEVKQEDSKVAPKYSRKLTPDSFEYKLIMLYKNYIKTTIDTLFNVENEDLLDNQISELIEFEFNLKDFMAQPFSVYQSDNVASEFYKQVTWINQFSSFPLKQLNVKYTENEDTYNSNGFLEFLTKSTSDETKANFLAWRLIQLAIPLLKEDFSEPLKTFRKIAFGEEDTEERWRECMTIATDAVQGSITKIYEQNIIHKEDIESVEKIARHVIDTYLEQVQTKFNWLDSSWKSEFYNKIKTTSVIIGNHEKFYNWIDTYNLPVNFGIDDHFEQIMKLKVLNADRNFENWLNGIPGSVSDLDVIYDGKQNKIYVPATLLHPPFYNKKQPNYLNYAGIGVMIAQSLAHVFDQFNGTEIKECLINQYNKYKVSNLEGFLENEKDLNLNAEMTVFNDMADNIGVEIAQLAYENFVKEYGTERTLISTSYSPNELFWIGFAQNYCSVERAVKTIFNIKTGELSPDRYRVIGSITNSNTFAENFKCADDSKMNPINKCPIL